MFILENDATASVIHNAWSTGNPISSFLAARYFERVIAVATQCTTYWNDGLNRVSKAISQLEIHYYKVVATRPHVVEWSNVNKCLTNGSYNWKGFLLNNRHGSDVARDFAKSLLR